MHVDYKRKLGKSPHDLNIQAKINHLLTPILKVEDKQNNHQTQKIAKKWRALNCRRGVKVLATKESLSFCLSKIVVLSMELILKSCLQRIVQSAVDSNQLET
mmetsp:Transcript_13537/g.18578  ORF Transcript_13537/g.18578 Transcript_13537/m.18578 type:complete len:102 (+) Transcript_13537:124-429(+)